MQYEIPPRTPWAITVPKAAMPKPFIQRRRSLRQVQIAMTMVSSPINSATMR